MSRPYYEDGGITLYHGDCREVLPALALTEPLLVIADPPYNQTALAWDRWPTGWPDLMPGKSLWCFGSLRMFMDRAAEFGGWRLSQDIVWEKQNGSGFAADRFRRVHEQSAHFYRGEWADVYHDVPITVSERTGRIGRRGQPAHTGKIGGHEYAYGQRLMRSVIYAASMHGAAENETQKPEAIVEPLVRYACPPGGLVVSPFAGAGTDLVVARHLGYRAIGVEMREAQCEVIVNRLAQGVLALS